MLIPQEVFRPGGETNGRALAYLAHEHLGNVFGTVYDVSTIAAPPGHHRRHVQNEKVQRLTEASYAHKEEVKKISSWAAIFFAPPLVAAVYGMNFEHMPELRRLLGYPFALALMVAAGWALHHTFKRRNWL